MCVYMCVCVCVCVWTHAHLSGHIKWTQTTIYTLPRVEVEHEKEVF